MITLLTGIPGSGKSYMAVHHVSKLKDQSKILHNIEGFKLGIPLDKFSIDNNIKKTDVFRKSWHEKNDTLHGWTIIIDEAAELFPRHLKDTDIVSFFDYHRHYGIDIFLITQDVKKVSPDITCLAESHYRAASGASNPIPGFLLYQLMVGGEAVSRKFIRKKKEVFALYKSTNNHSSGTLSVGKIYLAVALIAFAVFAISMKSWFSSFRPVDKNQQAVTATSPKSNKSTRPATPTAGPRSLPAAIGGNPFPVSTIRDFTGEHVVFCGNFYRKENFPFKLVKSRLGTVALLPDAVLAYANAYNEKLDSGIKSAQPLADPPPHKTIEQSLAGSSLARPTDRTAAIE